MNYLKYLLIGAGGLAFSYSAYIFYLLKRYQKSIQNNVIEYKDKVYNLWPENVPIIAKYTSSKYIDIILVDHQEVTLDGDVKWSRIGTFLSDTWMSSDIVLRRYSNFVLKNLDQLIDNSMHVDQKVMTGAELREHLVKTYNDYHWHFHFRDSVDSDYRPNKEYRITIKKVNCPTFYLLGVKSSKNTDFMVDYVSTNPANFDRLTLFLR